AASERASGDVTNAGTVQDSATPFDLSYLTDEESQGVVACRPAAVFRRNGMGIYRTMLNAWIVQEWTKAATALKFDPTRAGQRPPNIDLFEQVSATFRVYRSNGPEPNSRLTATMFTVRTTEPIDWVAVLRLFKMNVTEAHDGERV